MSSENYANPLKEAETDIQKATKTIAGLLDPKSQNEEKPEEEKQNSPELTQEESSQEDQPQEQEIKEEETEVESQEETEVETTEDVSQEEEQIDTQEKQDSPLHKVKVNGQEFDVTLDELRNGYSRDADYRQKTEELSNQRKQLQSESEKQRQDYSQKLTELNQMMSIAQQQLNEEANQVDLEKLYEDDPSEAMRIERRMKKKQEKLDQAMQQSQAEQKQQFESFLQDQQTKLVAKMPEFSDPQKASQLKASMKNTLTNYGFNNQEIAQVYDHRIVMLVNDAMKYRNMQSSKPGLAKKILKPGKVLSSGVKQNQSDVSLKAKREKLSRLKKSGSVKDAASIFLDMINNK
jgi:DNA repair exonuclease SbcCD ATPase subunit